MNRFAVILSTLMFVAVVASCDDDSTSPNNQPADHISIALERQSWYPASLPLDDTNNKKTSESRVISYWYNIEPALGVHRRDLDPSLGEQKNKLLPSLDIELEESPTSNPVLYAGVMRGLAQGGVDISQRDYIEIWVNDFKPDPVDRGGILHIDLGKIDENFYDLPAPTFNDEDKNGDGFNSSIDDTGLDGWFDSVEGPGEDPYGDNIDLNRINGRYSKINGTEGNLLYDTEDLDLNGLLGQVDAYFSYEIDLAAAAEIDVRGQYPDYDGFQDAGHANDSWRLYRIPLSDYVVRASGVPQPRFEEIRHVRIWFDGLDEVVRIDDVGRLRIQIAEFSIVGNR